MIRGKRKHSLKKKSKQQRDLDTIKALELLHREFEITMINKLKTNGKSRQHAGKDG